jgi:hypothetical protein
MTLKRTQFKMTIKEMAEKLETLFDVRRYAIEMVFSRKAIPARQR